MYNIYNEKARKEQKMEGIIFVRLVTLLKSYGWNEKDIAKLIEYITR